MLIHQALVFDCPNANDFMCFFALVGIILMIIENEITFSVHKHHDTHTTTFIKWIITFSTLFLILLVFYYHYLNMRLYCVNNAIQHWYVALSKARIIQIIVEVLICIIHPVPRRFFTDHHTIDDLSVPLNSTIGVTTSVPLSYIPIDVALGLPSKLIILLLCLESYLF